MDTRPIVIDTKMHGHEKVTAVFVVRGEQTALVETGPKSSLEHTVAGLEAAGIDRLDWIIVTHIHLDHAGAASTLAQRFPEATVAVHEVGAQHLVDPSKLWASASRIYGDAMERMWGGIDPLPADRIRALVDGDKIDLGGRVLQAVETPGHARHHHALLDDATGFVFTGDAMCVRLPDVGVMRPATPPPEFDLETTIASIRRIQKLEPEQLWLTHFASAQEGARATDVDDTCERAIESLQIWYELIVEARKKTRDQDEITSIITAELQTQLTENDVPLEAINRMEQTTSYRMNVMGYSRYMDKKEQKANEGA